MTKTDAEARIGTPEGAVRACVALIAAVTGQPEELTERYLDLYYQVRKAAECIPQSASPTAPFRQGGQGEAPQKPVAKTGPSETRKKVDFEEVLASASAGARMPEKQTNQPWGSVKREIRERFLDLRAKGMTIAQTVTLSGKKLTDGDVINIMNGGKAEMKIYNVLEDAMNKWEQVTASAAAAETDSTTE